VNRAVQKQRPPAQRPRPPLSKKHLSKHQREERLRRVLLIGTATVLALVLLIPLVGYYREVVAKASQPVAYVNDDTIPLGAFAKVYGLRLDSLDRNIQQMQAFSAQSTSTQPNTNVFAQQIQRLQAQRDSLDQTVLTEMVENRLIAAEAARRGIVVSVEEEDAQVRKEFADPATPTPNPATPSPTVPADATPSPSPVPTVDALEKFRNALANQKSLSEQEYRDLVVRPTLLREKLTAAIATDVPAIESQVHARHVLLESEDAAKAAKARIDGGEPFEKVAQELSTDTSNKEEGGDLGWFGRGRMTKPFEDKAFELPVGQVSDPVQTTFGWHIIKVEGKDEGRAIEESVLEEKRGAKLTEWLESTKNDAFTRETVKYDLSPDEVTWARNQLNKARGLPPER
jgi:parvulin-like peptidyl-prolyl isomerase